jgi:hypothetical protein
VRYNSYGWFWLSNASENKIAERLKNRAFLPAVFKKTVSANRAFLPAVLLYIKPYLQRIPLVSSPFWRRKIDRETHARA